MKKLQLLVFASLFLFSVSINADNIDINLNNPDVRKCLIDASKSEGWNLSAMYLNSENKVVIILSKDGQTKTYTSNQVYNM